MEPAPNTAQEKRPLSIDQIAAADSKSAPRNVRLVDAEVTPEAIARLAGKHWGTVTLVSAKLDGTILEPLSRAASIHTLRLFGGAGLNGQIARLQHVKRLRGLEIQAPLTGYSVEAIAALTQLEESACRRTHHQCKWGPGTRQAREPKIVEALPGQHR